MKEDKLWYFASKVETEAKGYIDLPPGTVIRDITKNRKFMFSIDSRGKKFVSVQFS